MTRNQFSRRDVNLSLLAATVSLAAGGRASAGPAHLFNFAIAGGYYHGLQKILPDLRGGMLLEVCRERDNPHDENAVAIFQGASKLGYIPSEANTPVALLLDQGRSLRAEIINFLHVRREDDIPPDLVHTGFMADDPVIALSVL